MLRLVCATALLTVCLCACGAADYDWAYLTGVYWLDGDLYRVDVTCWNVPGNPEGGRAWMIKMYPGGTEIEAPEGWWWSGGWSGIAWLGSDAQHWIPPGESLSGFMFSTDDDPGEVVYTYAIHMDHGPPGLGEFTPDLIPEPWLAGPLTLAALATWRILRRRP